MEGEVELDLSPPRHQIRVRLLITAFGLLGLATLTATAVLQGPHVPWTSWMMLPSYLFAALLVAGELRPLVVAREDGETDSVTVSTTFAVALVLSGPLLLAMAAQGLAVVYDDLFRRRSPAAAMFNSGQYMLTLAATRAVFCIPSGHGYLDVTSHLTPADLLPALAAGATFILANNGTVALIVAAESRQTPWAILRSDIQVQGLATSILIGLAPVTAIVADFSMFTLPLVVLPLVGVQRSALLAANRQRDALHDGLTGLPNRTLLHRRTRAAIEAILEGDDDGADAPCAGLLLLDLDHFKEVNDTLGHHVGDGLLEEVARRITGLCPAGVTVGRLGGDEFAVLVPRGTPEQILALAEQMSQILRRPAVVEGVRIAVLASIGVSLAPQHATTVEALFQRADIALYEAKEVRGVVELYREEINKHTLHKLSLLADLHAAVGMDQLHLVYQPIVRAGDRGVVALEALLRWQHPVHGTISPEVFIPLAEGAGVISAMSRTALALALEQSARLRVAGYDVVTAVNLSARLLSDLELPKVIAELVSANALVPSMLTVEVTESTIAADPKRAMRILQSLRETGVRIAVDDFGTGYSSLSYLSRLRPDELKVDRSFVTNMLTEEHSRVIVSSTIELGHALGMLITAEGVEDEDTYSCLVAMGCDRIQGFVVARPMPGEELARWLGGAGTARASIPGQRTASSADESPRALT